MIRTLVLITGLFISLNATADGRSDCGAHAVSTLPLPRKVSQESAVELEIGASDSVMNLLTTRDGTLHPVWPSSLPIDYLSWEIYKPIVDAFPGESALNAPWDVLTGQEQRQVLMEAAANGPEYRFGQRWVPGLKFKEKVPILVPHLMRLGGKLYRTGPIQIPSEDLFSHTNIEYTGSEHRTHDLSLELHVRSNFSAGENFLTARNLARALVGTPIWLHEHITASYPKQMGWVGATQIGALQQAAMISTDLLMMERKAGLEDSHSFFAYRQSAISKFMFDIISAENYNDLPRRMSKYGSVGFRNHHLYDSDVWGVEVRYITPKINDFRYYALLDALQTEMIERKSYGSRERAEAYLKAHGGSYEIDLATLQDAPSDAPGYAENSLVAYLYTNWREHILTFDWPEAELQQIEKAQKDARLWISKGMHSEEALEVFARKSGIRHHFQKMFPGVYP